MFAREEALPRVEIFPFDPWPGIPFGGLELEFRLVYDGRLPAASRSETRNPDKDRIRRTLSRQIAELFRTHPSLRTWHEPHTTLENLIQKGEASDYTRSWMEPGRKYSTLEMLARKYHRCGTGYIPLIDPRHGLACALDILFLRRDQPGNVIVSGGDLDNRIKVLLDALRMPQNCDEVIQPQDGQPSDDPIFVLLHDDRLVTEVKVTSDRLLIPRTSDEHINDVRLIIHAKTVIIDPRKGAAWLY